MRRFYYCDNSDSVSRLRMEIFKDNMLVPSNIGSKRADEFVGCTKAQLVVNGAVGATGDVTYTSRHGGTCGNNIFVEQTTGELGVGHESRALAITVDLEDEDGISILITYGTTSAGATITPTAQQIATLVNQEPLLAEVVSAASGGSGDAGVIEATYLDGGLDDGDWRKFNVNGGNCLRVNTVEVI